MSSEQNKYGLKRKPDEQVRKLVREKCGYGCVVCGQFPYDYHHNRIQFRDAKFHDPSDIYLLCDNHHRQATNNFISAEDIERACKDRQGVNSDARFRLAATNRIFDVMWAGTRIEAEDQAVLINGTPILRFEHTENDLEPVVLSGVFRDADGKEICRIENNAFITRPVTFGDMIPTANRFRFLDFSGSEILHFSVSSTKLDVTGIFMVEEDAFVLGENSQLYVGNKTAAMLYESCDIRSSASAIAVRKTCATWLPKKHVIKSEAAFVIRGALVTENIVDIGDEGVLNPTITIP